MTRFLFTRRLAFVCLAYLLPAGSRADSPDPLDAQAAAPPVHYQSPLKNYQGFAEQPAHDWREANDLVGQIGGWRAYAQEPYVQEPDTQAIPTQPAEPSSKPMETYHGHH